MDAEFVVTGSQVYGPVTRESDIDIVMRNSDAERLKTWLNAHNIEIVFNDASSADPGGGEYQGFYYTIGEMVYNIIIARNNNELSSWRYATEKMLEVDSIKDKKRRCKVFNRYLGKNSR